MATSTNRVYWNWCFSSRHKAKIHQKIGIKMYKNKIPFFSFFNKNIFEKSKNFISLIIIAGLIDIISSLIGISRFNLIEINSLNIYYSFPIGVFIWVSYFIFLIYFINYAIVKIETKKNIDEKKIKNIKETLMYFSYYKYTILIISFIIPIHNIMLILGVGLI
jgi:hypothetical protein